MGELEIGFQICIDVNLVPQGLLSYLDGDKRSWGGGWMGVCVPNEPNIQCEKNLQAKELEVKGFGDYKV